MKLLLAAVVLFFYLSFSLKTNSVRSVQLETCNFTSSLFRPGLMEDIKELIKQEVQRQRYIGESSQYAAFSCDEIKEIKPCHDPGYYWILDKSTGITKRVYCSKFGGWTPVANMDMRNESSCPGGLELVSVTGTKNLCRNPLPVGGCYSVVFPVNRKAYKRVRGKVIGYQFHSTNAFGDGSGLTIDDWYVDGVSITHGRPRNHIWTFAAGFHLTAGGKWQCPCTYQNYDKSQYIPSFVGDAYYCDIGTHHGDSGHTVVLSNALWDGENCAPSTSCCDNPNLPWFETELPSSTTDDIELRICRSHGRDNEDVYLEVIELYVQ